MSSNFIDIRRLEENCTLMAKTKYNYFDIKVINPPEGRVLIMGGELLEWCQGFIDPCKGFNFPAIMCGLPMKLRYKTDPRKNLKKMVSSPVIRVTITAADKSWAYEIKEDDENT
jgi:hypothetical protein